MTKCENIILSVTSAQKEITFRLLTATQTIQGHITGASKWSQVHQMQ